MFSTLVLHYQIHQDFSSHQIQANMKTTKELVQDTDNQLVITIKSMLKTVPALPNESSIYRVPHALRRINEYAYTPICLSIGPFHHGNERLQEMELHKRRYLNDFLDRRQDLSLEDYVRTLRGLEDRARNCYSENINYTSDDFVKMMLLDGYFIVELLHKFLNPGVRNKDDPIFQSNVIRHHIRRDMVLLENQLPFFILEHLFSLSIQGEFGRDCSFSGITLHFLNNFIGHRNEFRPFVDCNYQAKHIVDLYLKCYAPTGGRLWPTAKQGIMPIPNATRLHEAGVKFRQSTGSSAKCFLDVKFSNGVLEIPTLRFKDSTETFFRNLIAFEQCDNSNTRYISDYVFLMVCLIDTPGDVEVLRRSGIIDSLLGDDEEVSRLFNKLDSGVSHGSRFYYRRIFANINEYYNTRWNVWRAKLKRDYFNSPWAIMSVGAAVTLLVLAFIQSACSIIQTHV